ncbi:MAG: 3'(2'),5'-bisphosphate nucleotidase CysQ [Acidimicrobiales bacterium]
MTPSSGARPEDHSAARAMALEAADVLVALRREWGGGDGKALGARGDAMSQARLATLLAERHPGDGVLSEESADDPVRLETSRVWVIDPLDGTREFSEGRDDFAVHVALVIDEVPVCGAVALPGRDQCFATDSPPVLPPPHGGALRLAVSRTRPPALADELAGRLGWELAPMGSAGVKVMAVVTGAADVYVHGGGQYEWDSAAPVAVALAAGLHATRLDGSPLRYNRPDPWLPDLLVCRPETAPLLMETLASI